MKKNQFKHELKCYADSFIFNFFVCTRIEILIFFCWELGKKGFNRNLFSSEYSTHSESLCPPLRAPPQSIALYKWIQWLYFHGLGGSATMEYSNLDLILIQQRESAQILSVSQNTVRDVFDAQDVAVFIGMLCVI